MEVIILAGGLGTRLRSTIGNEIPKCMAPIAGKPFLWYILKYLSNYRIDRIILSVGYLRSVIIDWMDKVGSDFPFEYAYAAETVPLGTGGGIKLALSKTNGNDVCILNGDTYFNIDLDKFYNQHTSCSASVSIALKPMEKFDRYGEVITDPQNVIKEFHEKAYCEKGLINGGVYMINKSKTDMTEMPDNFSFETEVLEPGIKSNNIYGFEYDRYFIDIGIPKDYSKAQADFPLLFTDK